jgi:hypothetical protein
MAHLIRAAVMLGAAAALYLWLTAEVPGGEKRWEQWVRQTKDRHSIGI